MGIGTLAWGVTYPRDERPARDTLIRLVHEAMTRGVQMFDTADTYCKGAGDEHYVEMY